MIVILLSIVCLAAAKPTSQPGSYETQLTSFKDENGVEGLLYGVPEYEDPEMVLFQLAAMGVIPILTVLEMDEDSEDLKEKDATRYEDLGVKESLDRIIARLQMARSNFEKENSNILLDIEMPLHELVELDQRLTDAHPDQSTTIIKIFSSKSGESDFKSEMTLTSTEMSISSQSPQSLHKLMELDEKRQKMIKDARPETITPIPKLFSPNRGESDFKSEPALTSTEKPMSSESPESLHKLMELDEKRQKMTKDARPEPITPTPKLFSPNRGESDFKSEPALISTEIPMSSESPEPSHKVMEIDQRLHTETHTDPSTPILKISGSNRDESDFESEMGVTSTETPITSESPDFESRYHEKRIRTPLGEALSFTETNKYQDLGKATIRKKWTPKSLNTVEK